MKKYSKTGFSLTEVLVGLSIFALLALPAYIMFSYSTSEEMAYNKNAAANRIMESFRDEVKNLSYIYVTNPSNGLINQQGLIKETQLPPKTYEVYKQEKDKFSDLKIELFSSEDSEKTMVTFNIYIKWSRRGGSETSETLSFIKVK